MMQAADSPWAMRPSTRLGTARAPDGARPTSTEPTIPSTNPACTTFTRPILSAAPPTTTMKIPEKRAVIETAMFITLISMPRSSAIVDAMLSVVWANSQKARTPRMIPNRSRSLPT